jgi:hypothetical protein
MIMKALHGFTQTKMLEIETVVSEEDLNVIDFQANDYVSVDELNTQLNKIPILQSIPMEKEFYYVQNHNKDINNQRYMFLRDFKTKTGESLSAYTNGDFILDIICWNNNKQTLMYKIKVVRDYGAIDAISSQYKLCGSKSATFIQTLLVSPPKIVTKTVEGNKEKEPFPDELNIVTSDEYIEEKRKELISQGKSVDDKSIEESTYHELKCIEKIEITDKNLSDTYFKIVDRQDYDAIHDYCITLKTNGNIDVAVNLIEALNNIQKSLKHIFLDNEPTIGIRTPFADFTVGSDSSFVTFSLDKFIMYKEVFVDPMHIFSLVNTSLSKEMIEKYFHLFIPKHKINGKDLCYYFIFRCREGVNSSELIEEVRKKVRELIATVESLKIIT